MRRDMTVAPETMDREREKVREYEREREREREEWDRGNCVCVFSGNAMTNGLNERTSHTFVSLQSFSRSLQCILGPKMLIPEMKYFGDKRVPDEPPL